MVKQMVLLAMVNMPKEQDMWMKTKIDVYQITYECNDCKNIWTKKKKEKTNLGRTITGSTLY
jgi:hypothetical protein